MCGEMTELQDRRVLGGYSRRQVAELTGIHQTTIAKYESGSRDPATGHVARIRAAIAALEHGTAATKAMYQGLVAETE